MTRRRGVVAVVALSALTSLVSCRSDREPTSNERVDTTTIDATTIDTTTIDTTTIDTASPMTVTAADVVTVAFDSPGADPRPLREVAVSIAAPVKALRMRVTDLTYRGVVCGFTLAGDRPTSPLTISVEGSIPSGSFSSGPATVSWTVDGAVDATAPASNNGWSFSADAYPSRNGPGWAVSIGAVTGEGDSVIPTSVSCELRSDLGFVAANGPVGYWAGFATR
jgi:hypothetical protein